MERMTPLDTHMESRIRSVLNTQWAGQSIEWHETIDSTNRRAKELAGEGAKHGTLVISDFQSAGRGRMQRSWVANPGDAVLMTLLLRPDQVTPERGTALVLIGALAVCRALKGLEVQCGIKWPNDIVLNGRKVCGMLMEIGLSGEYLDYAALGIGINVDGHPKTEQTPYATSIREETGLTLPREQVVARFLTAFEALYDDWAKRGMEAVLPEYCRRSVTLGNRIQAIDLDGNRTTGTATGILKDGALVMQTEVGNEVVLRAGDVSVRGIMGYV